MTRTSACRQVVIAVQDEGVLAGIRDTLNFVGGGVAAVDNPPQNRVDVTVPGATDRFIIGAEPAQSVNFNTLYDNQTMTPFGRQSPGGSANRRFPIPVICVCTQLYVWITANTLNDNATVRLFNFTTATASGEITIGAGAIGVYSAAINLAVNVGDLVAFQLQTTVATAGAITWAAVSALCTVP